MRKIIPIILILVLTTAVYGLQVEGEKFNLLPGDDMNYTLTFYNEQDDSQNFTLKLISSDNAHLSCLFDDNSTTMEINIDPETGHNETVFMHVNGSAPAGNYSCQTEFDIPVEVKVEYFTEECTSDGNYCDTTVKEVIKEVIKEVSVPGETPVAGEGVLTENTVTKYEEKIPEWMWTLLIGVALAFVVAVAIIVKLKTTTVEQAQAEEAEEARMERDTINMNNAINDLKRLGRKIKNKLKERFRKKKPSTNFLE